MLGGIIMLHIDKNILRFWTIVGYRIGTLEFIWESPFPEAQKLFPQIVKEILSSLPDNLWPDQSSYQSFTNSILTYYLREDYKIYSSILLGIAIKRTTLIGASSNADSNNQMKNLALSALQIISDELIDDKDALFEFIYTNKKLFAENINKGIESLVKLTYPTTETALGNSNLQNLSSEYVFISYSSKDSAEAFKIRSILENNGISCWIAPDSIPSGADYGECIPKAIAGCMIFLLLISEKSQKSKWIPKELDHAIAYEKIIIPLHLDNSELKNGFDFRLINIQRIEAYNQRSKAYTDLVARILTAIHKP